MIVLRRRLQATGNKKGYDREKGERGQGGTEERERVVKGGRGELSFS